MTGTTARTAEEAAIRAVVDGVYAGWAANDAGALVADYAAEAA